MVSLSPFVALVLIGYLLFSIWNAYSTGYNKGMLTKHRAKGVITYGPYLSLAISFIGIIIAVFLFYELVGYYAGAIRLDLPADLANLDFLDFLLVQFTTVHLTYFRYVVFLSGGVLISALAAYITVRIMYEKGLKNSME